MDEDALREWELERAQEEEWELQHQAELELLRMSDIQSAAPPAKRALRDEQLVSASETHVSTAPAAEPLAALRQGKRPPRGPINPFDEDDDSHASLSPPMSPDSTTDELRIGNLAAKDSRSKRARRQPQQPQRPVRDTAISKFPIGGASMTIASEGRRVFIKLQQDVAGPQSFFEHRLETAQLLQEPIDKIRDQVRAMQMEEVARSSERAQALLRQLNSLNDTEEEPAPAAAVMQEVQLWVDEFAPRSYTDLISDEAVNRELLRWLRRWDPVVFRSPVPESARIVDTTPVVNKNGPPFGQNLQQNFKPFAFGQRQNEDAKIVLLSGPPGTGKTTLAHVVAHHAGYATIEINASDDRSVDALRERIVAVTQTQEVLSRDRKPHCLILDEIDGATKEAVNLLVQFVQATQSPSTGPAAAAAKKKSKKSAIAPMQRPIICICNDLQSPNIRALKQIAYVLQFQGLNTQTLVNRLEAIALRKKINTERGTLALLCELTDGDVRSCISTMQFLSLQKGKRLTSKVLKDSSVGQKDRVVDVKTVWTKIFHLGRTRANSISLSAAKNKLDKLLPLISANGEYDRLVDGAFENFLFIRGTSVFDEYMDKIGKIHDWLYFNQCVTQYIDVDQHFVLLRYLPYSLSAFHLHYASTENCRIKWPRTPLEANQIRRTNMRRLQDMLEASDSHLRSSLSLRELTLNVIGFLVKVLNPTLRPVTVALLSPEEKAALARVVNVMLAYNIRFEQQRLPSGRYAYVTSPPLDQICSLASDSMFNGGIYTPKRQEEHDAGYSIDGHKQALTYAVKQLIAQELAAAILRRETDGLGRPLEKGPSQLPSSSQAAEIAELPVSSTATTAASANQDMAEFMKARIGISAQARSIAKPETKPLIKKDFFGRIVEEKPKISLSQMAPSQAARHKREAESFTRVVWYRFNEGCSSAVRRPVKLRELLGE